MDPGLRRDDEERYGSGVFAIGTKTPFLLRE